MGEPEGESALVARAVREYRAALERLLLIHYQPLASHIAARLPAALQGAIGVEDILQEAFVQAFRDVERFEPRGEGSFASWLRGIAEHRLQDAVRNSMPKKRGGSCRRVPPAAGGSAADLAELLWGSVSTPSQSVARHEAVQAVQVAIAGLPDDYREAISLRYLCGKTIEETASLMARSPGAVRGLIDRAKERRARRSDMRRATWVDERLPVAPSAADGRVRFSRR